MRKISFLIVLVLSQMSWATTPVDPPTELKIPVYSAKVLGWSVLMAPDDILPWYYTLNIANINGDVGVPDLDCSLQVDAKTSVEASNARINCAPVSDDTIADAFTLEFEKEDHVSGVEGSASQKLQGPTAEKLFYLMADLSRADEAANKTDGTDLYSSDHRQSEGREDYSIRVHLGSRSTRDDAMICSRTSVDDKNDYSCVFLAQ